MPAFEATEASLHQPVPFIWHFEQCVLAFSSSRPAFSTEGPLPEARVLHNLAEAGFAVAPLAETRRTYRVQALLNTSYS